MLLGMDETGRIDELEEELEAVKEELKFVRKSL